MEETCRVDHWFARLDLSLATTAQRNLLDAVGALLDELRPAHLDPTEQRVGPDRGETWIELRHDTEPELMIELVLSDGWVNFYGVMGHDEAYSTRADPEDAWQVETVEILRELLVADYTIETFELRGKPWREVVTIRTGSETRSMTTASSAWALLLPLGRWASRTGSRRASFGCRTEGRAPELSDPAS